MWVTESLIIKVVGNIVTEKVWQYDKMASSMAKAVVHIYLTTGHWVVPGESIFLQGTLRRIRGRANTLLTCEEHKVVTLSSLCKRQKSIGTRKNITVEVEGDADRFACELQYETYRKALHKKGGAWESVKNEWNSGCESPSLCQVYGKLVGSELTALNANQVLGKLTRHDILGFQYSHGTQK